MLIIRYSESLKTAGIAGFYISSGMARYKVGVCDTQYQFFGRCIELVSYYDSFSYGAVSGAGGNLTDTGWVVYVPEKATKRDVDDVKE